MRKSLLDKYDLLKDSSKKTKSPEDLSISFTIKSDHYEIYIEVDGLFPVTGRGFIGNFPMLFFFRYDEWILYIGEEYGNSATDYIYLEKGYYCGGGSFTQYSIRRIIMREISKFLKENLESHMNEIQSIGYFQGVCNEKYCFKEDN